MADLVTLEDYKTYATINSTTNDAKLSQLISSTSKFVRTYCGREFEQATYTERLEVFGNRIFPTEYPIDSVTSLGYYNPDKVLTDITEYEAYPDYIQFLETISYKVDKPVEIEYVGGYLTIPEDLQLAVFDLITYYNKREVASSATMKGETINRGSINPDLPAHIKRVLNLYRLIE